MITGEESRLTPLLKAATKSAISASNFRVSEDNKKEAIKNEIKLLQIHQNSGRQTPEERERSLLTIESIKKGGRRFNLTRGYYSVAPINE